MKGRRKGWDNLSPAYRRRLEKGGVGRAQYESGAPIRSARGHAKTPESPTEYAKNPGRFKEYREKRKDLIQRVVDKKAAAFQAALRWNERNSEQFVRYGASNSGMKPPSRLKMVEKRALFVRPPTTKQLQQIDAMTVDELIDFQYQVRLDDDWRFLWYH